MIYYSIAVRIVQSLTAGGSAALVINVLNLAAPKIVVWSGAYLCPNGTDYCEACRLSGEVRGKRGGLRHTLAATPNGN
jgi:hypothetical protein